MGFRPKRLPSVSVDAPLQRRWEVMGDAEAHRLHEAAQAEVRRFSPFAPRVRRRALRCFVGTPIGFAVLGWLFVGGNPRVALAFFGAGIALGTLTFFLRPLDYLSGLLYAGCAALAGLLLRQPLLLVLLASMLFGCFGIVMGRNEELRRVDGSD